jgi:peptidoglycan/LPS O-acetylase OafA/YrhL
MGQIGQTANSVADGDPAPVAGDPTLAAGRPSHARLEMLDGWRAISILTVLAGHMLPLGPRSWALNGPVAALGMAIFFTLSGFLVVSILLRDQNIIAFAIKRIARILPLAWAVLIVVLGFAQADAAHWLANLFFYANLPPFYLDYAGHLWSLSVEMQFYLVIGIVVAIAGVRGLWVVPVAALVVTAVRIATHEPISIVTWLRVDEILAGGTLALLLHERTVMVRRWLRHIPFPLVAGLFLFSAADSLYWLNFARPYLAATMVGITIVRTVPVLSPALVMRPARYIAAISYALYIFHPFTTHGWLGSGEGIAKYVKRPICFLLSFGGAHLSTYYYERPINGWAHRIAASRWVRRAMPARVIP